MKVRQLLSILVAFLAIVLITPSSFAASSSTGGSSGGGNPQSVITPGESHSNGKCNINDDHGSHANATMSPWADAAAGATHGQTKPGFKGSATMDAGSTLDLGSSNQIDVTGGNGTTVTIHGGSAGTLTCAPGPGPGMIVTIPGGGFTVPPGATVPFHTN